MPGPKPLTKRESSCGMDNLSERDEGYSSVCLKFNLVTRVALTNGPKWSLRHGRVFRMV